MNKRVMGPIAMILAAAVCVGLAVYQVGKSAPKGAAGTYTAGTYTATAQGFGGEVTVNATFTDAVMSALDVAGAGETPEIGGAAIPTLVDAAMTAQGADIDGVSGATVTSTAVKQALAECFALAKGEPAPATKPSEVPAPTQASVETAAPTETPAAPTEPVTGEVFTGKGTGFGGADSIVAELTMADGKITAVKLNGDAETPQIGGAALAELSNQVMTAQGADIDGISGATITSTGVKEAVAAALAAANGESVPANGEATPEPSESVAPSETPVESAAPSEGKKLTGKGKGFNGDIVAELTMDGSKITDVKLTGDGETPAIGGVALDKLAQQVKSAQGANIDGVSGATLTSNGVKEAVAKALGVSVPSAKETPAPTPTPVPTPEPTPELTPEPVAEPSAAPAVSKTYNAGTYTASAKGFAGDVTVTITVSDDAITDVSITGASETPAIGGAAMDTLAQQAKGGSIDGVSGATLTSNGAKEAFAAALAQAKA